VFARSRSHPEVTRKGWLTQQAPKGQIYFMVAASVRFVE
jgi:hypothetical protein